MPLGQRFSVMRVVPSIDATGRLRPEAACISNIGKFPFTHTVPRIPASVEFPKLESTKGY